MPLTHLPSYPFPCFDKLAHVGLYGGLAMLVCRFAAGDLKRSPISAMLIAAAFTTLYGFSDEIHQSFVPERFPDAVDFAADIAGALLAVAMWFVLMRPKHRPMLLLQAQPQTEKVTDDVQV
jgi:VanZ family protein